MTLSWWLLLVAAAPCPAPDEPVLLVVTAADPDLRAETASVERRIRRAIGDDLDLLPASVAHDALTAEGGRAERARAVIQAQVRLEGAFDRFRELEDAAALQRVAEVIARLSAVSQSEGSVPLLAEAHLLAGAIFLARGRIDAAQARLRRALALAPDLRAPSARYAPRVRAELAALRGDAGPLGLLEVGVVEPYDDAEVFVDGRPRGTAPLQGLELPAGRHLIRVSAPGHQSFHTTVRVPRGGVRRVQARLLEDPEVRQITEVARWLNDDGARRKTLDLIARRAEADSVLLAELRLSDQRSPTATATHAVVLRLDDRPPQTSDLTRDALATRFERLMRCEAGRAPPQRAPALALPTPPRAVARPRSAPDAWWTRPWVWAAFAVVAVGAAAAVAAARNDEGPPGAVEITLIPRP